MYKLSSGSVQWRATVMQLRTHSTESSAVCRLFWASLCCGAADPCFKSHLGITKTCLEVPGISHLDSCPKTHAFLRKESRKTSSHGADRLAAGKQCWSEQLNGFVQGGESEIVTALRKAKALDDLEIISKCPTPVTPGHGSFQSEKKLKSKLHKLLPMD